MSPHNQKTEMALLREKLTRIAVAMDVDGDENQRHAAQQQPQHSFAVNAGHFQVFPLRERPSTPPSSPQPRDVLRKQLWLRNRSFRLERSMSNQESHSSSFMVDGVCVDSVEISLPNQEDPDAGVGCLAMPEHLRVVSSSVRVMNTYPEGLRKRKSMHVVDADDDSAMSDGRLKRASSQLNFLTPWPSTSCQDQDMDDVSTEDPVSVSGRWPHAAIARQT